MLLVGKTVSSDWCVSIHLLFLNPLTNVPAKSGPHKTPMLQNIALSQLHKYCRNCQLWVGNGMSFKFGYLSNKHKKHSNFYQIWPFEIGQERKWPFLTSKRNDEDAPFCLYGLQNQASTIIKFSPCSSLEMTFFVHDLLLRIDTAFCSSAFKPSHHFQHLNCIVCWEITTVFNSGDSFP